MHPVVLYWIPTTLMQKQHMNATRDKIIPFHCYLLAYEVKTKVQICSYINPCCSLGYQCATWPLAYVASLLYSGVRISKL